MPVRGVSYNFDLTVGSDWYQWIKFLATRYNPQRGVPVPEPFASIPGLPAVPDSGFIDCLEFVNEATGAEGWPQRGADRTRLAAPSVVAQMFKTARYIREVDLAGTRGPLMLGPATQDRILGTNVDKSGLELTSVDSIWTHHNYEDVTFERKAKPTSRGGRTPANPRQTNGAAIIRKKLERYNWRGWPRNRAGDPRIFLTEGGAIRTRIGTTTTARDSEQRRRLEGMWEEMRDEGGLGKGVSLFTNWLFYQQLGSLDTGLRDPAPPQGTGRARPAYRTWATLRTTKRS